MDLSIPQTIIIDVRMITAFIGFIIATSAGFTYGYARLVGIIGKRFDTNDAHIANLQTEISAMKRRNEKADAKTGVIEEKQKIQETTIAVMANDMTHIRATTVRTETAVKDLADYIRATIYK